MLHIIQPLAIDVARYENIADFSRLVPIPWFVYCKATQGTEYVDPTFANYFGQVRNRLGARRGAYHYFEPGNPIPQADHFVDTIQACGFMIGDVLIIDVEEDGTILDDVKAFMDRVEGRTGTRPWIYIRELHIEDMYPNGVCPNWLKTETFIIAEYPGEAVVNSTTEFPDYIVPEGINKVQIAAWQYSDRGQVYGCEGRIDLNMLNPTYIQATGLTAPTGAIVNDEPITFEGKIFSWVTLGAIVRETPGGSQIDKLSANTPVKGIGELVPLGTHEWLEIVEPMRGFIAAHLIDYAFIEPTPDPDPNPPALPDITIISAAPTGYPYKVKSVIQEDTRVIVVFGADE